MREYLLSNSKPMIVIAGSTKTKEEVLLAQEKNLPIISVAMTGGTTNNVWLHYHKTENIKMNFCLPS